MKRYAFRYTLFLFIILGIISCKEETDEQEIGQEYLSSEDYREFEQLSNQEIEQKENQISGLTEHLKELPECRSLNGLSFPFVINKEELTVLQQQSSDCSFNSNDAESRFSLSMLGTNNVQGLNLYWVLVDWESMYTDQELFAVTVAGDSLRSFKKVGIFKKNLTRDINTKTHVQLMGGNIEITSVTNRKIIYPIEQDNMVITKYSINPQGTIREL